MGRKRGKLPLAAKTDKGYIYRASCGVFLVSFHSIKRFRQRVLWRYHSKQCENVEDDTLSSWIRIMVASSTPYTECQDELEPFTKHLDGEIRFHEKSRTGFVIKDREEDDGKVLRTCFSAVCRSCGTPHGTYDDCPEVDSEVWRVLRAHFKKGLPR